MKNTARFLFGLLLTASVVSCSKDDDSTPATGSKEYQVEYKVTSSTNAQADGIIYANETGGNTQLSNVVLPKTYSFKRTMKQGDALSILADIDGGTANSEITASIMLDGKEVKKETGRGESAQAVPVYVIGE